MASSRSAQEYADFLLPHLTSEQRLVDVGCGTGELSLQLAAQVGHLIGIDDDPPEVASARRAAEASSMSNADFIVGDVYALPLPDNAIDVVFGHSVLETLDRPATALLELGRVLKRNGIVALACVEYGGLILAGPHEPLVRRFFDIRERLWQREGVDPYRGRELRGLLVASGFAGVRATTTCISYGSEDAVREFGTGRADDCTDPWYVDSAQRAGLATAHDLAAMREAWLEWSASPTSYAAFTWCRALGWKV